jgi:O-antigen ligase
MPDPWTNIGRWSIHERMVWGYGLVVLLCVFGAVILDSPFPLAVPPFLLLLYISVVDFRQIFWMLIFCLPLSTEYYLPNGFGTDLPTEPLMIGLTGIGLLYLLRHGTHHGGSVLRHPITLALFAHLGWIFVTTITSDLPFVSVKFLLAKLWYIIPFYFLTLTLVVQPARVRRLFWVFFWPLMATVVITMVRHGLQGFTFESIHFVLSPYQRNHVNYAAMLAYSVPLVWFARAWYPTGSWQRRLLYAAFGFLLVAVYLSYTRAAYIALMGAAGMYFVFRWKLVRYALVAAAVAAVLAIGYMARNDKYLEYAPNYDRTVTHYEFDNLIEATYKMEDISTMERVYRWVAGFHMTSANPILGFGPGNFVNFYESYTVTSFRTYVSDNPERSGIHSYYLMTLVEQGVVGLFWFLILVGMILVYGERIYHQTTDPADKAWVMGLLLCLVIIDAFQIINDLLETDKVGPMYFMAAALLVRQDLRNRGRIRA